VFLIEQESHGRFEILKLRGRLTRAEVDLVEKEIAVLVGEGRRRIVLDMAGVTHADFRVLSPLFGVAERLERAGYRLHTVNLHDYLRNVLSIAFTGEGASLLHEPEAGVPRAVNE
jgi:anti-anti-sigma regulatory factor